MTTAVETSTTQSQPTLTGIQNTQSVEPDIKLRWRDNRGDKTDLAELVWVLAKSNRIFDNKTGKPVTIDVLANQLGTLFVVSISNPMQLIQGRKLTFRLVPRRTGAGQRVEVKGSLHKFYNFGEHNADQFTATDLLMTLDQLVSHYGIDPFTLKINTIEFGVNVVLPFPVAQLLQNLVSYKSKPFSRDTRSQTPYCECRFQRFTIKLYDKGKQRGLDKNLLRFEIKVAKMIYFDKTGVYLNTLADLLKVANYRALGALLVDTFSKILFDDPTINAGNLTPREREIYQNGRNTRYWQLPDDLPTADRARLWKQRQRTEQQYRALIDRHQQGNNWQVQTTALISYTWQRLTRVTDQLLTQIDDHRATWCDLTKPDFVATLPDQDNNQESPQPAPEKCPLLTDLPTNGLTGAMSIIDPLYSVLQPDTIDTTINPPTGADYMSSNGCIDKGPKTGPTVCIGGNATHQRRPVADARTTAPAVCQRLKRRFVQSGRSQRQEQREQ
ncbi:hypothetical protein [Spirosoma agri]|uniref:hypothetical protein n=1 Tax=Spirosoma agri TaxID=1987381 RepID=UPI001BAF57E2|nr:hypothetical protein [Spirosoma agri]